MSESEMKRPFPIPDEVDFGIGATLVDGIFENNKGAWFMYHRQALIEAQTGQEMRKLYLATSSLARSVEPINDDTFKPEDPLYRATHAFRAGMWTAGLLGTEVYNGRLSYIDVHNTLSANLPHEHRLTSQDDYEKNGEYLMALGNSGLEALGFETREYIQKWGEDIVSEPTVRQYYAMGTGAVMSVYHNIYAAAYPSLQEDYEVSKILDFNELENYLSSNFDSSSN